MEVGADSDGGGGGGTVCVEYLFVDLQSARRSRRRPLNSSSGSGEADVHTDLGQVGGRGGKRVRHSSGGDPPSSSSSGGSNSEGSTRESFSVGRVELESQVLGRLERMEQLLSGMAGTHTEANTGGVGQTSVLSRAKELLTCTLCRGRLVGAVVVGCGHCFCHLCLEGRLRGAGSAGKCPVCDLPVAPEQGRKIGQGVCFARCGVLDELAALLGGDVATATRPAISILPPLPPAPAAPIEPVAGGASLTYDSLFDSCPVEEDF